MKRILFATLVLLAALSASAMSIDITNHPDKDFMLGYKQDYPGCDVSWWASQWNTEHIMGVGDCEEIAEEKVMSDMVSLMEAIRKLHPNFNNFSEYFRWRDALTDKINQEERARALKKDSSEKQNNKTLNMTVRTPMPTKSEQMDMMRSYFCIDTDEGTYFFSEIRKPSDPKWRLIAPKGWKIGDAYSGEWIAFQTSTKRDLSVLASLNGWTFSVPMKAAYACSWMP